MTVQFKHTYENTECFGVDFSKNPARPYFSAAFTDGYVRIWSLSDLVNDEGTLDKPKFEIENGVELGPVDVKFNSEGNRIATSSVDSSLRVFNILESAEEQNTTTLKSESPGEEACAWKLDFSPDGSELLTGTLGMRTLDIETLKPTQADFNAPSKFIHSLAYSPDGQLSASGNIDGVVQIFDMRLREEKIRLENHGMAVRALKF